MAGGDNNKISDALAQVQQRNISAVATDQDTHRVHVFTAFDDRGNPYRVGVDSFAEISLIDPDVIKPQWNRTRKQVWASEIGGKQLASEFTTMPFKAQWGAATDQFDLYVIKPPDGIDILMGSDIQDVLGTIIVENILQ